LKFTALIEMGMVVDTTMPISIFRETFPKCHNGNDLHDVVPVALPLYRLRYDVLTPFVTGHGVRAIGKTASLARKQEARP
jgi:hypothetical protein